jgi:hypothetical protein
LRPRLESCGGGVTVCAAAPNCGRPGSVGPGSLDADGAGRDVSSDEIWLAGEYWVLLIELAAMAVPLETGSFARIGFDFDFDKFRATKNLTRRRHFPV